jgi:hypothetical protein
MMTMQWSKRSVAFVQSPSDQPLPNKVQNGSAKWEMCSSKQLVHWHVVIWWFQTIMAPIQCHT